MNTALKIEDPLFYLVNYEEINQDFPAKLDQLFGLQSSKKEIASMKDSMGWYSKNRKWRWKPPTKKKEFLIPIDRNTRMMDNLRRQYEELELKRQRQL